jgi:hypothetical protein
MARRDVLALAIGTRARGRGEARCKMIDAVLV